VKESAPSPSKPDAEAPSPSKPDHGPVPEGQTLAINGEGDKFAGSAFAIYHISGKQGVNIDLLRQHTITFIVIFGYT